MGNTVYYIFGSNLETVFSVERYVDVLVGLKPCRQLLRIHDLAELAHQQRADALTLKFTLNSHWSEMPVRLVWIVLASVAKLRQQASGAMPPAVASKFRQQR